MPDRLFESPDMTPWLHKLTAQRDVAIGEVKSALAILDRLYGRPGFDWVDRIAREYRNVLNDLRHINPDHLPSREEMTLMAVRLRLLDRGVQLMARTAADPKSEELVPRSDKPT